jgi:hypothetical protein
MQSRVAAEYCSDFAVGQEGSISFLKKRNKKLLLSWLCERYDLLVTVENQSFLVLFFKKELLP